MKRISALAIATMSLLVLGSGLLAGRVLGQDKAQETSDVGRINAASQVFNAAIVARDINAMDKVWAHEFIRDVHRPSQHNRRDRLGRRKEGMAKALQPV